MPLQVEERCKDCSDGKPCCRILCDYCFNTLGFMKAMRDTSEAPRPGGQVQADLPSLGMDPSADPIDWVRGLNPNRFKGVRLIRTAPQPRSFDGDGVEITPPPARVRKKLSLACTAGGEAHKECSHAAWCECGCHSGAPFNVITNRFLALSEQCSGTLHHSECDTKWCECVCHDKRVGPDPSKGLKTAH